MLIRREQPGDPDAIHAVHAAAFAKDGKPGLVEARLVDDLRALKPAWIPALSLVAIIDDTIVGHVCCTRSTVEEYPALGLGPLGVAPGHQRGGVGQALVHAVLGAADALGETVVVLWGIPTYYPRFGFRPAADYGIHPAGGTGNEAFQARTLTAYRPEIQGAFRYSAAFGNL
ncbi:MAG TPA: N-acetyltransferase [Mycobacteriales bacterium]|jgi:putative acetyltransferase|nr:N-acetyltransferase [Mycobacteriales bacterium]